MVASALHRALVERQWHGSECRLAHWARSELEHATGSGALSDFLPDVRSSLHPRPPSRLRHRGRTAGVVVTALCVLIVGACSQEAAEEPEKPAGNITTTEAEALRALPYVAWTEDANPELRGITVHDEERAWAGVNLYMNRTQAFLVDMQGHRLNTWNMPEGYDNCEYFELLDNGDIIVVCVSQGLLRLDWGGRVVWRYDDLVHHDVHVLGDGSFLVPVREKSRRYKRRLVIFDGILHLSPQGELLDTWSTFDHLDVLKAVHEPSFLDTPGPWWRYFEGDESDYYHLNTIETLGDTPLGRRDRRFRAGNWLLCLRNADLIVVVDHESREIVWSWGPGDIRLPHMPTQLEDGNLLIYDNQGMQTHTRVLELEPSTRRIVWQYESDPPDDFFSPFQGSNQRLPNGNTLICESAKGRAFEVTPEGELVWEFWNPELRKNGKQRRAIYRLTRLPEPLVRDIAERARARLRGGPSGS